MQVFPLEEADLEALKAFLESDCVASDCMPLSELDGFLTGIAAGPEIIPPSDWLPLVWGAEAPSFSDPEQARAVLGSIMSRYNQILSQLEDGGIAPIFESDRDGRPLPSGWADGFAAAMDLGEEAWDPLIESEDGRVLLMPILMFSTDMDVEELIGLEPEEEHEFTLRTAELIPGCVNAIAEYWRARRAGNQSTPAVDEGAMVRVLSALRNTGYDRKALIDALGKDRFPRVEIALATVFASEIESDILAIIERAAREDLDDVSRRLLFRGIHILGGRRLTGAYRPFLALLSGTRAERIVDLLGDAVMETLPQIFAGLFDGDPAPLEVLIMDPSVDQFVRDAAVGAIAFLTFEGRIERAHAEEFLARLGRDNAAPSGDMVWHGWMRAVGLLGIDRLVPQVEAAFQNRRIPRWAAHESDFNEILTAAKNRPTDGDRFADEGLGYIEDTGEALESLGYGPDEETVGDPVNFPEADTSMELPGKLPSILRDAVPVHNPFRGVGRNDPCPCGSGKKFKRCCMQ